MSAFKKRSPAPRANAGDRVESTYNSFPLTTNRIESKELTAENPTTNRDGARYRRALRLQEGSSANSSLDFQAINHAALAVLRPVLHRILPGGKLVSGEYVVRNPTRLDRHAGSFRINIRSGRWADFATDDRGGDIVSLVAYVEGVKQVTAARLLVQMLGMKTGEAHHV